MSRFLSSTLAVGLLISISAGVLAQSVRSKKFDKLKLLEGKWKGTRPDGQTVEVSYKLMSGGSVLVETLQPVDEQNMITIYHMDGDKLMMTHYCSAGNQPRMVADTSLSDKGDLAFCFVDATNMKDPAVGHMKRLKFIFINNNHIQQIWTWSMEGKEMPETFDLNRVM